MHVRGRTASQSVQYFVKTMTMVFPLFASLAYDKWIRHRILIECLNIVQCLTYFMLLFPFLFQISITTQVDIIKIYVFCTTWSKTNENMH